jgi:hypothetical protein
MVFGINGLTWGLYDSAISDAAAQATLGKTITALSLGDDDALHFEFSDGTKLRRYDAGQACCERRYMRTDDDLSTFVEANFLGAEIKDAPSVEMGDDYIKHDVQFLGITTDRGVFTMASHNERNGWYGGFTIRAEVEEVRKETP